MSIELRHIHKRFASHTALQDINLDFPGGELVALLGPSGCGKTTLLRIIAGLEQADEGQVLLSGADASATHVRERQVGFVFQHYALFRHMTVFENVAFGLRVKPRRERPREAEIRTRVMKLLELVQLDWLAQRHPAQLSGGQRQRIALARALAVEPQVLLLDEPFGALDAQVRKELRRWLRRLHDELHVTTLFVTHDQEEALEVADRVVLMNHGEVAQVGTPEAVYEHPASPFVFHFLGAVNLFHGRHAAGPGAPRDDAQVGFARPHELELHTDISQPHGVEAVVQRVLSHGARARVELEASPQHADSETPQRYEVELPREQLAALALSRGQRVRVRPARLRRFERTSA